MENRVLKVHPAIGIARLGNAERGDSIGDGFFVGPETPGVPANWDFANQTSHPFKKDGKIKAQAARFRIWEYIEKNGKLVPARELNLDNAEVVSIEWTVHLANRKASFFKFMGRKGEADNYASTPASERRNNGVPEAERTLKLEIDEGAKSIQGKNTPKVEFRNSKTHIPIEMLGELRTDAQGRLLVLGGKGQSNSSLVPPAPLPHYANNDNWFDDISDGPVTAKVTLKDENGTDIQLAVEGAWILIAPPDFAPPINNVITLYDALWDVAVRELTIPDKGALYDEYEAGKGLKVLKEMNSDWKATGGLTDYKPSFTNTIFPIFNRAFLTRWVHEPLNVQTGPQPHHNRIADARAAELAALPGNILNRKSIFSRMRLPNDSNFRPQSMPKAFGDDYDKRSQKVGTAYLSQTRTQYALLNQWMLGNFVSDWQGIPAKPTREEITPEGLDRAALENSVGGAFYPGIEASWLIRKKEVFSEPFRIKHDAVVGSLKVRAGFFSQQMAVPWQADFLDCAKEEFDSTTYHAWWVAQRPDDVFKQAGGNMLEWARGLPQHEDMVRDWSTRGFVIENNGVYVEQEGPN